MDAVAVEDTVLLCVPRLDLQRFLRFHGHPRAELRRATKLELLAKFACSGISCLAPRGTAHINWQSMAQAELEALCEMVVADAGEVVLSEDAVDKPPSFILVASGEISVSKDSVFLARLTAGQCVGEAQLLLGRSHAVTARLQEPGLLLRFPQAAFAQLMRAHPRARAEFLMRHQGPLTPVSDMLLVPAVRRLLVSHLTDPALVGPDLAAVSSRTLGNRLEFLDATLELMRSPVGGGGAAAERWREEAQRALADFVHEGAPKPVEVGVQWSGEGNGDGSGTRVSDAGERERERGEIEAAKAAILAAIGQGVEASGFRSSPALSLLLRRAERYLRPDGKPNMMDEDLE
jgi:CRP-like cAMP-binding protein